MSEPVDWSTYTVQELKTVLSKYGLPVSGLKAELITRVQEHEQKLDQEEAAAEGEVDPEAEVEVTGEKEEGENGQEYEHGEYEEGETTTGEGEGEGETGEKGELELLEDSMDKELQDMMGGDVSETEEDMEFVTLDKCGDANDDAEDKGETDRVRADREPSEPGETKDDESLPPLPPDPMRKYLYKQFSACKRRTCLCVSPLGGKDVLCGPLVEWANRAMYFCINHSREARGTALLNFSTRQECEEARESLTRDLPTEVKVTSLTDTTEEEVRGNILYEFDSSQSFPYRTLIIDAAPENTTIENIGETFPDAVLVVKFEITEDRYTWGHKDYSIPENIRTAFLLEYASERAAAKVVEEGKTYELKGTKLEVKLVDMYEDKYKRYYAKKLNEAREKRWERLEQRRKAMKQVDSVSLTDSERLDLYTKMDALTAKRARIADMKDVGWDEKLLRKNEVTAEILDIVRKVDADADRRMEDTQKFPESYRAMTKHSRECFKRTPAYSNYQEYMAKKNISGGGSYRGRYFRGSSSRYDRGRERESYGSRRRSASGDYRDYDGKRRRVDDYEDRRGRHDDGTVDMLKSLTETLTHKMTQMERLLPGKERYRRPESRPESSSSSRYYDNYSSGSDGYSKSGGRQGDYHQHQQQQHHYRGESSYRGGRSRGYQGRNYNPNYRGRGRGNRSYNTY